jgi:type IV pilus assembly protein PilF
MHLSTYANTFLITLLLVTTTGCGLFSSKPKITTAERKADLFYQHGTHKLVNKDYTSALDLLLKAQKLRPNDTKIENNIGMTYFFKHRYPQALTHFKRSISVDKKNSDARNNLASLYYHLKKYDLAHEQYQIIQQDLIYKHQYRVHYNLALIYLIKKERTKAIQSLKQALKEKSDYCAPSYLLGTLANKRFQYQQAYKYFKDATMGTCYNNAAPHYQQALTLIKMKKYTPARLKLDDIIENFDDERIRQLALTTRDNLLNATRQQKKHSSM